MNALTGEEVTVWLTDTGACAENKRRKSLKNLRDSYKMGNVRYKLEPGGLVHFKGCFAKKDSPKNYISTWANVVLSQTSLELSLSILAFPATVILFSVEKGNG